MSAGQPQQQPPAQAQATPQGDVAGLTRTQRRNKSRRDKKFAARDMVDSEQGGCEQIGGSSAPQAESSSHAESSSQASARQPQASIFDISGVSIDSNPRLFNPLAPRAHTWDGNLDFGRITTQFSGIPDDTIIMSDAPRADASPPQLLSASEAYYYRVEELNKELGDAADTIGNLENKVDLHDEQLRAKDSSFAQLQKELDTANAHISTRDEELLALGIRGEITESIKAIVARAVQDHRKQQDAHLAAVNERLTLAEAEREQFRNAYDEAMTRNKDLLKSYDNLGDSFTQLTQEFTHLKDEHNNCTPPAEAQRDREDHTGQIANLRVESAEYSDLHDALKNETASLKNTVKALQRDRDAFKKQSTAVSKELEDWKARSADVKASIVDKAIKDTKEPLDKRITELESQLTSKDNLIKAEKQRVETQMWTSETATKSHNAAIKSMQEDLGKLRAEKNAEARAKGLVHENIFAPKPTAETLTKDITMLKEEKEKLQAQIDASEKLTEAHAEEKKRLQAQIDASEKLKLSHATEVKSLQDQVAQLQTEKTTETAAKGKVQIDLVKAKALGDTRARETALAKSEYNDLKDNVAKLLVVGEYQATPAALVRELAQALDERDISKAKVAHLEAQLKTVESSQEETATELAQNIIDYTAALETIQSQEQQLQGMEDMAKRHEKLQTVKNALQNQLKDSETSSAERDASSKRQLDSLKQYHDKLAAQLAGSSDPRPDDLISTVGQRLRDTKTHPGSHKLLLLTITSLLVVLLAMAWDYLGLTSFRTAMHYSNALPPAHSWHVLGNSGGLLSSQPRSQYGFDEPDWLTRLVGPRNVWRIIAWSGYNWEDAATMRLG